MINRLMKWALQLLLRNKYKNFLCFLYIMTCLSHPTEKNLFKVKSRNTILICYCGQRQQ